MAHVITETCAGESDGAFVFKSSPNHSLTRSQERCVFWGLAVLFCAAPGVFALMGYWLMLPFAGLEVGLLAWAFKTLRRREGDYEMLMIEGDVMVLECHADGCCERRELNRKWARVDCDCRTPGRSCRLTVSSHGRATELGQYLNDEERLKLAATLRSKLQA
jgi:uncharacterized membrane protein